MFVSFIINLFVCFPVYFIQQKIWKQAENDTYETTHTHRMAQKLFPPEMEERIEERMNLRLSRLAEKCSYYGLDVLGKKYF